MNLSKLVENTSVALLAQTVSMLTSIATVILAPKVMDVGQYAYWQLFTFYSVYVNILNFGINDGVYLLNGGKSPDEINKRQIASLFWFSFVFQLALALAAVPVIIFSETDANRTFVLLSTAAFMVVCNLASYIGYIFQAINETKIYSQSVIVERGVLLVGFCILLSLGVRSFELYVFTSIGAKTLAMIFCLIKGREFVFIRPNGFFETARDAWNSIKVGFQLLIAVNAGTLVVGVARFVIDSNWSIETFGMVSFSLSIVNFIMAFVGQVAMVLFPALSQCTRDELIRYFTKGRDMLAVLAPAALILYWPACAFVDAWLPDYREATYYMALLVPLCLFDSRMNILSTTYFKVLHKETAMLVVNVASLAVCAIVCSLTAVLGAPVEVILIELLIVVAARSIVGEMLVSHMLQLDIQSSIVRDIMPAIVFIAVNLCLDWSVSLVTYSLFLLVLFLHNHEVISDFISSVKHINLRI